jgi:hypothetical protein
LDVDDAVADCEPLPRQELHTDHLAGVFRNFSAFKDGRAALLAVEDSQFLNLCTSLRKGCDARRVAISECARNIALDPATANKAVLPQLIAALTLPFAPGCELRDGDETNMPMHLLQVAAEPASRREHCAAVRLACIESLRFIASTASGRSKIDKCKIYPCLRDAHLAEQDDTVRELIEEVVELTQLI